MSTDCTTQIDGAKEGPDILSAVAGLGTVSRETVEQLERFVALLRRWQRTHNLVSAKTLDQVWSRHIADSAQIVPMEPEAKRWVDLGSGGGFPGIVIAILIADRPGARVDLIESNGKKAAFLRAVVTELRLPAKVHCGRIEDLVPNWPKPADVVTARALAPLKTLCDWSYPLIRRGAVAVFHKGQDFEVEYRECTKYWALDLLKTESAVDSGGTIIRIADLQPLVPRPGP